MLSSDNPVITESQLKDVDDVYNIVRNLSSADETVVSEAMKKADAFLKAKTEKTGFDRTIINHHSGQDAIVSTSISSNDVNHSHETSSVDAFKAAVEQDAASRAKQRSQKRARASKLKERANTFFKAGDWRRATELYSQAIELSNDWDVLYTNRAQAYLRLGDAVAALKDCDTAIRLYSFHLSTNSDEMLKQSRSTNAKAFLHRGKALMALDRPSDALESYESSRTVWASIFPSHSKSETPKQWPDYLVDYVAQAEAAVTAQEADAKAEADFESRVLCSTANVVNGSSSPPDIIASQQLVCLLAQLARGNQDLNYYIGGLRQLTRLLTKAPRERPEVTDPSTSLKLTEDGDVAVTSEPIKVNSARNRQHKKKHRAKAAAAAGGGGGKQSVKPSVTAMNTANKLLPSAPVETLSDLQTLFRSKKGFSLLNREVDEVIRSFGFGMDPLPTRSESSSISSVENGVKANGVEPKPDYTDRLLALINLASLLVDECGENQRILVTQYPKFITFILQCLTMESDFRGRIAKQIETGFHSNSLLNSSTSLDQLQRHKLESIRVVACTLVVTFTSHPSGRQALLSTLTPAVLLEALAHCLEDSLCRPPLRSQGNSFTFTHPPASHGFSSNTSLHCASQAAQILENLTESPSFLIAARSSANSVNSLLSVIEAALPSASSNVADRSIITTTQCLSSLLDSLSTACQDAEMRVKLLRSRRPLLLALANCLTHHAPLLCELDHARLIGSACRLLHNICIGQVNSSVVSAHGASLNASSDHQLIKSILDGTGAILDQTSHGPELRSVALALTGRLFPLASEDQVISWLGVLDVKDNGAEKVKTEQTFSERLRILLAVLDSCSPPAANITKSTSCTPESTNGETTNDQVAESNCLSNHLISGCIRCLAAATTHSLSVRYAIGDDRRRVRRLASLIRTKRSGPVPSRSITNSQPSSHRDEPLSANTCLILQHCCDDTPLAEHLQGTSVILDLLMLIQESRRAETKRNAAILVGKLAQSSHVHRNELSRLDGWSVLTPFNSWSTALGQY